MRKPLPAAIQNAPELDTGAELLFEAFNELHTCRQIEGGRIPWTAINEYIRVYGIEDPEDPSVRDDFAAIIRQLDDEFLIYMAQRAKDKEGKGGHGRKGSHNVRKPRPGIGKAR